MQGIIEVLNTGTGHTEIRYDPQNPMELERAKRVITDLMNRGAVLFVHGDGDQLIRVEQFDPQKGVYIVGDMPSLESLPAVEVRGRIKREVPAETAKVTAVARSAGGGVK